MKAKVHKVSKAAEIMRDVELGRLGTIKERREAFAESFKVLKDINKDTSVLVEEMEDYHVELVEDLDFSNISMINNIFTRTQMYMSRVSEINAIAINMVNRWEMLINRFKTFIEDVEDEIYLSDEVKDLPNARLQKAYVRNKVAKYKRILEAIEEKCQEAKSFKSSADLKLKDLKSVLSTLNRQIRTLSLEKGQ